MGCTAYLVQVLVPGQGWRLGLVIVTPQKQGTAD